MSSSDAIYIKLDNVSIYQKQNLILSNINLSIKKGEFVYLIGKTGSGKSSILKTLYADIPLKQGEASILEFDLKKIKKKLVPSLRRKLGIVFQDFQLLTDRSVNENLEFVLRATGWKDKEKMQNQIQNVLEKVGLATKGFKMPYELSGGEQQRVTIARALLNNPEIILADEPTGNLDPETSDGIMNLLIDINKNGTTILLSTHDKIMFEKYKFRSIKCEDGKVIEV